MTFYLQLFSSLKYFLTWIENVITVQTEIHQQQQQDDTAAWGKPYIINNNKTTQLHGENHDVCIKHLVNRLWINLVKLHLSVECIAFNSGNATSIAQHFFFICLLFNRPFLQKLLPFIPIGLSKKILGDW